MIGRVYKIGGAYWHLRVRCEPFDRGPRRNVLLVRVAPWRGVGWGDQWFQCRDGLWWRPDADGELPPWTIRPFRGLQRAVRDGVRLEDL